VRVLSKSFTLTVALLYVVIGLDSSHVPLFPTFVWPLIFTAVALGVVHTTFQPDRKKLRLITAMVSAAGVMRGGAYLIQDQRAGPMAGWLLISMLSVAYYLARRDFLPENYGDDDTS